MNDCMTSVMFHGAWLILGSFSVHYMIQDSQLYLLSNLRNMTFGTIDLRIFGIRYPSSSSGWSGGVMEVTHYCYNHHHCPYHHYHDLHLHHHHIINIIFI